MELRQPITSVMGFLGQEIPTRNAANY